jgi:cytochrome P450
MTATPTPVHELELPEITVMGFERDEALAAFDALRDQHWLVRQPMGYLVTRYEDVVAILRDRRFHSALSMLPQLSGVDDSQFVERRQQSILSMEGVEHSRLRRLVAPAFTPAAADRLRPFMREVVNGLVDEVAPQGRCELVADVCEPYPIPIICELLGAPKEDWKLFSQWATDIFRIFNGDMADHVDRIRAASDELDAYVRAMIDERRAAPDPPDDLLSALIAAEEAGDRLSTDELVMMAEAVLMAGTDTTRNQLACSVALLSQHPDQWALVTERPELASRAVEETMRHLGAVRGTARIASEDVEYRGVLFPKGTFVATSLLGANYDPRVWDDPHTLDVTRTPSQAQMTFGSGIHHCMGASLARAELQEAVGVLAARLPDLRPDGPVEWKPATVGIWGPARLPLAFTATT